MKIQFTVYGTPQHQGSVRAFMPKGAKHPVLTTTNKKLKSWRQEVAGVAFDACEGPDWPIDRTVPVSLVVVCFFARPKSLVKKQWAKVTQPDLDKHLRAVGDALTGIVYTDDAQIVDARIGKRFGLPERTEISVSTVEFIFVRPGP